MDFAQKRKECQDEVDIHREWHKDDGAEVEGMIDDKGICVIKTRFPDD